MTTETASTEVAVVEPTLASVREARKAANAKAKEERRIADKTYALQGLDQFSEAVEDELKRLDDEVKRVGERRKVLEEALAVAKSIDTNVALTAEEIRITAKKAADVYYGRKEGDKSAEEALHRAVRSEMIQFIEPRRFFEGAIIAAHPSRRGL